MSALLATLRYRRLVLSAVIVLALLGAIAWQTMDRQEDPFFPYRYGQITVQWPGADPLQVERLVLNPLEEELAQVEDVNEIQGTARTGVAHLIIGMGQHVYDTDTVWERVRVAADRASRKFPEGTGSIEIDDRSMDTQGIVLAVTGSDDLLELADAARQLRRDLFAVGNIARVELLADPGEQITLRINDAAAMAAGIGPNELAAQIAGRNRTLPGGSLQVSGRDLVLQPTSALESQTELETTPIRTDNGSLIPLNELASLHREPADPPGERMWWNGQPAVGLGLVIPENRLNAVALGEQIRGRIDQVAADYKPLEIREMFYQPEWVERRLSELGRSLLIGVVIVALLLLFFMGLRLGLTVATILPMVTLSALAVYAMGGGVLHQMAVAGLVIALGMLVDNAIVMVENIQWHIDRGLSRAEAASRSVAELAAPLATATFTTLAAFTPLLLARGDTADFTRGIPILVMLVLAMSYLYAVTATPVTAAMTLARAKRPGARIAASAGRKAGALAVSRPGWILAGAAVLLAGAIGLSGLLDRDFFPSTDRNEMVVDLHFPEGTSPDHTAIQATGLAHALEGFPGIEQIHVFTGSSGPRFYYNLMRIPGTPHRARLAIVTRSSEDLPRVMDWLQTRGPEYTPDARIIPNRLGQGPPVAAPVEIRVFGKDLDDLARVAEELTTLVRETPGTRDVRNGLSGGLPTLVHEIDDAEAARYGLSRQDVAATLFRATRGETVATWRAGREPVPVILRQPEGSRLPVNALDGLQVAAPDGRSVALGQLVRTRLELQPAVIEHLDLERKTAVLAETRNGVTYNQVLDRLKPRLDALELPEGTRIEIAGSAAEAGEANTALFQTIPIGILLLLIVLLLQFNSFRLVGIVLVTVPLAAIGVVPGLLLTGQPFSFTAILGVVALVGIVVNNAIVLIDLIGRNRGEGMGRDSAIIEAVSRRARPILLTTATTIAGLLPLTFTSSTLWPPMAWAIISGLMVASLLTLLVIPALYRVVVRAAPGGALSG